MKQIKFLEEHCEFKSPHDCYVLLAISRKKDTPEITNSKEIVFREVLRRTIDIGRKLRRLKLNCENYRDDKNKKYPFYIYITMNARDSKKTARIIMNKLIDCFYEESLGNDRSRIFKRIDREFISNLMKKESRSKNTKYFMIDFDTKAFNELKDFFIYISEFTEDNYSYVETRNGYHFKCLPFDKSKFRFEDAEVKSDGLFFVEYVKNE